MKREEVFIKFSEKAFQLKHLMCRAPCVSDTFPGTGVMRQNDKVMFPAVTGFHYNVRPEIKT